MFKELKSSKTFQKSIRIFKNFNSRVGIFIGIKKEKQKHSENRSDLILTHRKAVILTTQQFYFIAKLIQRQLKQFEISSEIIFEEPQSGFSKDFHFVISAGNFKKLPNEYAFFQTEQLLPSKSEDSNFYKILESAKFIFDYSLQNIDLLQRNGVSFRKLFYLPVYYYDQYCIISSENSEEFDIALFGNINSDKYKEYFNVLSEKFKIKVIDEYYGEELCKEIQNVKVVLVVGSNKESSLDVTKIFEFLSLNKLVFTERNQIVDDYKDLTGVVEFTEIDKTNDSVEQILFWLQNDKARIERVVGNTQKLIQNQDLFSFYFNRFLLSNSIVDFKNFFDRTSHLKLNNTFLCLGLPETISRIESFRKEGKDNVHVFHGLRNSIGWIGCGLSYKYIMHLAKQSKLDYIIVCEDDVQFGSDFDSKFSTIISYLNQNLDKWDVFSGFIADVHRETEVCKIDTFQGMEFVYIDKLMSTVFNIYNKSFFEILSNWDENNLDKEVNTIDRYIERSNSLRVVTTSPYLVGHKEDLPSSIWNNVQNTEFNRLINKSTELLEIKINWYKKKRRIKSFLNIK